MKSSQHTSRPTGGAPAPTGPPWIVGLVVVGALAGGLWLRHTLQSAPPAEDKALVTRPLPTVLRRPPLSRRQPDPGFDADVGLDSEREPAPVARGRAAPARSTRPAPGTDAAAHEQGPAGGAEPAAAPDATGAGQEPTPELAKPVTKNGATLSLSLDGSPTAAEDTTPIIAHGLEVDQTAGATRFPFGAQLAYPDRGGIDPTQSTLAFWARLDSAPDVPFAGRVLAQLRGANGNSLQINMGSRFIGLVLTNADGEQAVSYTAMPWAPGVWHHIATTWGEGIMQLYIDGNFTDQASYAGTLELPPDAVLYIGSQRADPTITPSPDYPTVSLRAWNVFPTILEPDQVATLMMQTAPPT